MAETVVTAPMVGKVVSLEVKVGDKVQTNQTVVVIEAMKMKVNVVASAAGTVKEIKVAPGDAIDTGAALVVLE